MRLRDSRLTSEVNAGQETARVTFCNQRRSHEDGRWTVKNEAEQQKVHCQGEAQQCRLALRDAKLELRKHLHYLSLLDVQYLLRLFDIGFLSMH
jgi:hypothetical protein